MAHWRLPWHSIVLALTVASEATRLPFFWAEAFLLPNRHHGCVKTSFESTSSVVYSTDAGRHGENITSRSTESQSIDHCESKPSRPQSHVEAYVRHWEYLLQEEHYAAVLELKEQRSRWSRQRLEASGVTLFDVSAEPDSELFGEKLVRVYLEGSVGDNRNAARIKNGRNWRDIYTRGDVMIMTPTSISSSSRPGFPSSRPRRRRRQGNGGSKRSGSSNSNSNNSITPREVCVVDVGRDWMTVSVGPTWPVGLWESRKQVGEYQVRLDRTVPQSTLIAQKKALDLVRRSKAGRAAQLLVDMYDQKVGTTSNTDGDVYPISRHNETGDDENAGRRKTWRADDAASQVPLYLRYLLEDSVSPETLDNVIAQAINRAKEKSSFQPNSSQEAAIAWALARSLSLIRGPPGTGKTVCAALLISSAMRLQLQLPITTTTSASSSSTSTTTTTPRVLAVAHSNGAADVLLQALLDMGVPAIRVGRPASVSASLRHRTVVAMAEKHPEVKRLRAKVMDLTLDSGERGTAAYEVGRCMNDVRRMLATNAPVVVASCIGAHQLLGEEISSDTGTKPAFPIVVLDEAAQATEPSLLCALAAAKAEQIIFVGDTRQLPPTVASDRKELRDTLGVSPMSRLESSRVGQQTLRVQYRMAPALLKFPSSYFYDGLVTCADSLLQQQNAQCTSSSAPPVGFPWPESQPLAFVQLGSNLEATHDLGGKSNPAEAAMVVDIIYDLVVLGKEVEGRSIAAISPYAKQCQLIRTLLISRNLQDVRVGTVDSFQGQETDVVVFSAVRSNVHHEIGFLRDPRRLCVALTRAKRGLIIVGDPVVLQASRHWSALLDSCRNRGCMLTRDDVKDGDSLEDVNKQKENSEEKLSDADLLAALEASLEEEDGLQDMFSNVP